MENFRDLRERLQGPRRAHDTFYGRQVMRRLSIYLTFLFSKTPIRSEGVTLISLVVGLMGVAQLFLGHWFLGILLVNGWYLLDHVDGELARLRQTTSVTGLYFDTISNAFVPPLTFAGLGVGLAIDSGNQAWQWWGLLAAYGSMLLLILPFCEATVLLQSLKDKKKAPTLPDSKNKNGPSETLFGSCAKWLFSKLHWLVMFPVFLPIVTLGEIFLFFTHLPAHNFIMGTSLVIYAVAVTVIWLGILTNTVISRKLDQTYSMLGQ